MGLFSPATLQPSFPELYEQWLVGPVFRPWAELTLDEIQLVPGDRLLDVACGTGIVARTARERLGPSARITGIDQSPEMLAVAQRKGPDIDWRQGNAAALPLHEDEQFSAITCQQGLQFFPDKPAAVTQMRRSLVPGGRLAISTWLADDEVPFFHELRRIAERHLGPVADQRHSFGDAAALEALLRDAGFQEVRSRTITRIVRVDADSWLFRGNAMALVGMSAAGKAMDGPERHRVAGLILSDSEPIRRRYTNGSQIEFELSANLAIAV